MLCVGVFFHHFIWKRLISCSYFSQSVTQLDLDRQGHLSDSVQQKQKCVINSPLLSTAAVFTLCMFGTLHNRNLSLFSAFKVFGNINKSSHKIEKRTEKEFSYNEDSSGILHPETCSLLVCDGHHKVSMGKQIISIGSAHLSLKSGTKKLDFQISCLKNLTTYLNWKQFTGGNSLFYMSLKCHIQSWWHINNK